MEKLNGSIVISEDDRLDRLDDLLAADSPVMKVQCTEDDALDLDELLRKKDDDDDETADQTLWTPHTHTPSTSPPPPRPSSPLSPLRALSGRSIFNQGYQDDVNNNVATAAGTQPSPSASTAAATLAENESRPVSPPPVSPPPAVKTLTSAPPAPILAEEDDEDEGVHWVMPAPAKPGDFLTTSINKVPSKSILKKVSSYGNFDASKSSVSSYTSGKPHRTKSTSMDSEAKAAMRADRRKPSFLNLSMGSASSNRSEISGGSSYGVGLDLGDSSSLVQLSPRSQNNVFCPVDENSVQNLDNIPPPLMIPPPSLPILTTHAQDADRAAGSLSVSKSLDLSSSGKKMTRSVSFHSVDVREYDRTVGDNPSCRSGPPLSLDWSYSKKYEQPKTLEQYEIEREDRARSLRQLHVNKYRRRNLLSFNWGHSEEDMKSARKETKKLQRQRSLTQALLPIHMVEEAFISVKGFIAKKRGKAECPKEELQKITDELSKSTEDTSFSGRLSTGSPTSYHTAP